MNRTMTSLIALGVGVAAYNMRKGNNHLINGRTMKQMRKRISRALF